MFVFRFILLAMVLSVLDTTISVCPFGIFEFLLHIYQLLLKVIIYNFYMFDMIYYLCLIYFTDLTLLHIKN